MNCTVIAGTRGLGAAIVRTYAENGWNVHVVGRNKLAFDKLKQSLQLVGEKQEIKFTQIDLDLPSSPFLVYDSIRLTGRIDCIVYNYGGTVQTRRVGPDLTDWLKCLWKNVLFSAQLNALTCQDESIRTKLRRIIHISSASGRHLMGSQLYSTAKALLNSYVRTNGRLLAKEGIVQMAIAPGALDTTDGPWKYKPVTVRDDFLGHYQFCGFLGSEDTVAKLVYCLSGPAGDFCHGNIIECDGGSL